MPSKPWVFLIALSVMLPLCTVLFSAAEGMAESRYVNPSAEVVVRTGEGNQYKIIDLVKDGDAVDLLEEGDSYALVRLADGKEGWMLKRFLSVSPPPSRVVVTLRAENEKMKQKVKELTQKSEEVAGVLSRTETQLAAAIAERDQVKTDFQNLQEDTADVIQIKNEMLKATKENEVLNQEMASLKEENKKLAKDKSINWFVAGGGVLLVGMFLGRLSSKSRRRKSSLV